MDIIEVVLKVDGETGLRAARAFYGELLDLRIAAESPDRITFLIGKSHLTFVAGERGCRHHFAINIPENRINAAEAWIKQFVPLIHNEHGDTLNHFTWWNAHAIYFFDPLGNVVELIARHTLHNASDQPFNAGMLLEISEVGLPSRQVIEDAKRYSEKIGTSFYLGASTETFTAVGDEHGLLIVVSTKREWYPYTGVPAADLPEQVLVRGRGGQTIALFP